MKKYSLDWWQSLPPEKVGKETETLVEKLFAEWNTFTCWAHHRLPDAKAARGRLASQPADWLYRCGPRSGFIEAKALKHEFRLSSDRLTQHPTLAKWTAAGSSDLVLVHHYMQGVWRVIKAAELPFGCASWNLREMPTFPTPEAALRSTGWFEGVVK